MGRRCDKYVQGVVCSPGLGPPLHTLRCQAHHAPPRFSCITCVSAPGSDAEDFDWADESCPFEAQTDPVLHCFPAGMRDAVAGWVRPIEYLAPKALPVSQSATAEVQDTQPLVQDAAADAPATDSADGAAEMDVAAAPLSPPAPVVVRGNHVDEAASEAPASEVGAEDAGGEGDQDVVLTAPLPRNFVRALSTTTSEPEVGHALACACLHLPSAPRVLRGRVRFGRKRRHIPCLPLDTLRRGSIAPVLGVQGTRCMLTPSSPRRP